MMIAFEMCVSCQPASGSCCCEFLKVVKSDADIQFNFDLYSA